MRFAAWIVLGAGVVVLLACGPDTSDCRVLKNCVAADGGSGGSSSNTGGNGGSSSNTGGNGGSSSSTGGNGGMAPFGFEYIDAGVSSSCALMSDGGVRCWGDNAFGQLGNGMSGSGMESLVPIQVAGLAGVEQVSVGFRACVRLGTGSLSCWGMGPLGDGSSSVANGAPTSVMFPSSVVDVSCSVRTPLSNNTHNHTCVVLATGEVRCWGQNLNGALGIDPSTTVSNSPVSVQNINNATAVAAGQSPYPTCRM